MNKPNQSISTRSKKVGGFALGLCCLAILSMSVLTGTSVYADAGSQQSVQVAQEETMHEQRMLARTIDGDTSPDEWEWEVSESTRLAENNIP